MYSDALWLQVCECDHMVGKQSLRMDNGSCSGALLDDSPGSSPSSSPGPEGRRREMQRARPPPPGSGGSGGSGGPGASGAAGAPGWRGRPAAANAARERSRVQTLRTAFLELQRTLPAVPPDTKLSKLDVLILATTYIAHLTKTLQEEGPEEGDKHSEALPPMKGQGYLHPVKVCTTTKNSTHHHIHDNENVLLHLVQLRCF